jgi:hypothetical protein
MDGALALQACRARSDGAFPKRNRSPAVWQCGPADWLCDNAEASTGTPAVAVSPIAPNQKKPEIQGEQMSTEINAGLPEILFHGCSLKREHHVHDEHCNHATQGAAPAGGARRQTVVGGKRVKTIDVHCHCVLPETLAMMGLRLEDQRGPGIGEVGLRRVREMDEAGIDVEAISINPFWYKAERDVA